MPQYAKDPRWIRARYASVCPQCGKAIKPGEDIYYWPSNKKAYCKQCGKPQAQQFTAEAMDEMNTQAGYGCW